ncbi:4-coumarate--CoA ligase family protein [Streptomyces yaizuensis]|uniref:4-coumarate--CoA ligase family protein n=1 Tax=Streptomyces yaizuensis TaxID=2989713 RepID=A0ABQ5P3Y8_9ACTN|nr:4-coumarate--CoA ligase family protein [Streptomyces sp. YSPA8]GLF97302.1 4-coumarate--CoA ligase family protein [Streptomyces sp. YSPA8]
MASTLHQPSHPPHGGDEHVFRSTYPDVAPVSVAVHDTVLGPAAGYGDAVALIDGVTGARVSYARLDHDHRRIAAALAAAGVRKGDVLALHSPNSTVYPAVFHGATRAGASVTTVNSMATAEEFARQLQDCAARWIITVAALLDTARRAAELVPGVREIFVCDRAEGHTGVPAMLASTAPEPDAGIDPDHDIAVLPYSSGTTGTPKGVMLTHRSVATNLAQIRPLLPMKPGDRILAVLPFFHIYGLTCLMNAPLQSGATVVVLPRFELESFLAAIEKHRVTGLYMAPPIVLALAKQPAVERYDLSSLEYLYCGAAPLDARLAEACGARLGLPAVRQGYGMTELSPGAHIVPLAEPAPPPGTVGRLVPGTEMKLLSLDDPGRCAGPGEDGEIAIRGPQVMKGYLGRPEATAEMIDAEGWLRTGDVGRVDDGGWLFVVDRVKELIKYKGYQVAPAELEALLLSHEAIADAAVVGAYDEDAGTEIPHAFVVRRPGTEPLTATELQEWVAARVAPYKKVRRVSFVSGVPRAASGKILRRELRTAREPRRLGESTDREDGTP